MRIFFATDVHGSEICWRKFLNAGAFHKADVLIMGGDMTGKAMVPIVATRTGWEVTLQDQHHDLTTEDEVAAMEKRISDRGYYPVRLTPRRGRRLGRRPEPRRRAGSRPRSSHGVERWMAHRRRASSRPGRSAASSRRPTTTCSRSTRSSSGRRSVDLGEGNTIDLDGFDDDLDRLGEPDALEHLPGAARGPAPDRDRRARRGGAATRIARSSTSTPRRTARTLTARRSSTPT